MFRLKSKAEIFGINEEASDHGTPVFEKNLDSGIQGEANRDGTIFVQKGMSQKKINEAGSARKSAPRPNVSRPLRLYRQYCYMEERH